MEEWINDPKLHSIFVTIFVSAGVYLVRWLVIREVRRIDEGLKNAVKRNELEQLREDMNTRHTQNRTDLTEIKTMVTSTHQRIDDLYRFLANGNSKPRP